MFAFRFKESLESNITVCGICTDHRVSTYRLPALTEPSAQLRQESRCRFSDADGAPAEEGRKSMLESAKERSKIEGEGSIV